MKILITGATGLVGRNLIELLVKDKHDIYRVIRKPASVADNQQRTNNIANISLDELFNLTDLDGFDAVINLAGEPIMGKRWTNSYKTKICDSRWLLTQQLADLIENSSNPPHTFISASAIGIYPSSELIQTEFSDFELNASNFTQMVCQKWESIANSVTKSRVCIIRSGLVMAKTGGMLVKVLPSFRMGLGAKLASGKQHMAFIHIDDEVSAINFLLTNNKCSGAYNLCIPQDNTNKKFTQLLAKTLHRPQLLSLPLCKLKLLFGEASQLLTDDQHIVPQKLLDAGFVFKFATLEEILNDLTNSYSSIKQ